MTTLTTYSLQFPVLLFDVPNIPLHFSDEEDLTTSTDFVLRKGYLKNLIIIDSNGKKYLIKEVQKTGYQEFFPWWYLGLWRLFRYRQIKIKLELLEIGYLNLDELKQYLRQVLCQDPDFWESGGESLDELEYKINQANSFTELINALWVHTASVPLFPNQSPSLSQP